MKVCNGIPGGQLSNAAKREQNWPSGFSNTQVILVLPKSTFHWSGGSECLIKMIQEKMGEKRKCQFITSSTIHEILCRMIEITMSFSSPHSSYNYPQLFCLCYPLHLVSSFSVNIIFSIWWLTLNSFPTFYPYSLDLYYLCYWNSIPCGFPTLTQPPHNYCAFSKTNLTLYRFFSHLHTTVTQF